jgi:multiple sugar transport system permease protein
MRAAKFLGLTSPDAAHALGKGAPRRRSALPLAKQSRLIAIGLTLPAWLLLLLVFAIPMTVAIYLSFRNEQIGTFLPSRFVGFENFRTELSRATFWRAFGTTLTIMLLGLLIQLPSGLGLAILLHRELRGSRIFRSALLIPMLLTPVAVGLMWRFMFDTDLGVINWLIGQVGAGGLNWLGERWTAILAVVIVDSWQSIPFVMLMSLAALAGMPTGPLEAAKVDGAGAWQTFWHIMLPMLRTVLLVTVMIRIIDSFKLFDLIFIMTNRGGPGTATQTLGLLTYNTGFSFLATSRAAALGVSLVVISMPIYILWRLASPRT